MATVTRVRGCFYYTPWIATLLMLLIGASIGIWAYYTNKSVDLTVSALNFLNVTLEHLEAVRPAFIATSAVYAGLALLTFSMSLWRSAIEAGHDSTGLTTGSSTAFLVCNAIVCTVWYFLLLWTVIAILADTVWIGIVYVLRYSIAASLSVLAQLPVQPTYVPSTNAVCPSACLNLSYFSFFQSSLQNTCICNQKLLKASQGELDIAIQYLPAVEAGVCALFIFGLLLLLNFSAQFSHTKREKDLISRLTSKQFSYA